METQVRGLLSLGRGERRPDVRCDAAALLADVAALVEPACAHSRVALEVATRDSELCVWAEIEGLRAAVLNLTLNAIEAAGAGGHVALKARAEEATVVFEVIDTGPGPPAALAETLGEPFVTGKPEGVGLGLALARQVATDHGGALSWRRERDKTVFCLTLPAMQRVEERRESASARLRETEADSSIARIS
jgi:signal transduction histidine kinase